MILVDTSVWINYFKMDKHFKFMSKLFPIKLIEF